MKKIILLIMILFLTGCSVKYDLVITDEEKVKEKIEIPVENEDMLEVYNTVDEYIDYYSNLYSSNRAYSDFEITTKKGKKISKFYVTREYESLDEYIESLSFKSMYNKANIQRTNKYVTFTTTENVYLKSLEDEDYFDSDLRYEDFEINIKFYNKVVDSNATRIDEKNNIYTWDILSDTADNYIMFKISDSKRYDILIKDIIMENILAVVFFGILIVVGIVAFIYVNVARIKNNRI